MARQIVTQRDVNKWLRRRDAGTPPPVDKARDALSNYIPGEVISFYTSAAAMLPSVPSIGQQVGAGWFLFALAAVGTFAYAYWVNKIRKVSQLIVMVGAFVVWAIVLGGPFSRLSWYNAPLAGLFLMCYLFIVTLLTRVLDQKPQPAATGT
jgi:hypothetical protein